MGEDRELYLRYGRRRLAAPFGGRDLTSSRWFRRLLDSAGLQHLTAGVCTLAVIAFSASAFVPIAHGKRELLIAVISASLGWLMFGSLNRQRRAVCELRAREQQLAEQSALLQSTLENMG